MYEPTQDATWIHGIDLAQEADFDLGFLHVRPAKCEVEWDGAPQVLQRRVMQVLVTLAHAQGSVISQNDLVMRCWRGLSVSDDAIFRCISKLRKLAAGYADAPFAIETIPGVGYRLTSPGLGQDEPQVESRAQHEGRFRFRPLVAVTALLLLVMVGVAFWIFRSPPDYYPLQVAVQPFEALSDSVEARSLARRIPNKVVDVLGDSQIGTVLVGKQAKAAKSASPAPGLIVTGILRDDGHNTVVDLRLEDGASRAALWSTEFRRNSREASDLPLEVAARVADAVNMISFARNADPPLTDDVALTALIQTADMIRGANSDAWAPMVEKARDIVARHPDFAFGHSILAAAYAWASERTNIPDQAKAMRESARQEAILTLRLDPQDAGAYAVLSELVPTYDHRRREEILLRGIRFARHPKQPLAALYSYEGLVLGNVGRLREALSFQLVAHANDEWGAPRTTKLALIYANMGNVNAARGYLQKAVQYWPNHPGVWGVQQYIAGFYETPSDALQLLKLLDARISLRESNAIWQAFVEAKAARSQQAVKAAILKIRVAADRGTISREHEIMMIAGLGETKQAITVANSVLDHQELQSWFLFTPAMRDVRQDSGFVGLASRMGLIRYWRETGKRPDFCSHRASRSECTPQLLAALQSS